jgi:hypothetical protein
MQAQQRQKWMPYLMIILAMGFCYRFVFFDRYMASSLGGDSPAHLWINHHYCQTAGTWINPVIKDIYYPIGINLRPTYDSPFLVALTCPVNWALGPVAQFNFFVFLQMALVFFFTWWFAKRHLHNPWLQLTAVTLNAFSGFAIYRIMGQTNLLSMLWGLPLIWGLLEDLKLKERKSVVKTALAVAICFCSCWQNLSYLTPLILFYAVKIFRAQGFSRKIALNLGLGSLAAGIFCFVFAGPMFLELRTGQYQTPTNIDSPMNADLLSYVFPPVTSWTYKWIGQFIPVAFEPIEYGYTERSNGIDLLTFLFLPMMLWQMLIRKRWPQYRSWLFLLLIYVSFSFGALFVVANKPVFPTVIYNWLSAIPPFSLTRNPARYSAFLFLAGPILWLVMIERWLNLKRFKFWGSAALLGLSFILVGLFDLKFRYPVLNFKDSELGGVIKKIKADPDPSALIMTFPARIPSPQIVNFIQIMTGKKMVLGYMGYTLFTAKLKDQLDAEYGSIASLNCTLFPESNKVLQSVIDDPTEFFTFLKNRNVKYLNFDEVENLEACETYRKWERALMARPEMQLIGNFGSIYYRIKD